MIIAGLDEAGKGSVFGNLCIGCYVMKDDTEIEAGDSKKYSKKKRERLYNELIEKALEIQLFEITANELNEMHNQGMSMIEIEEWGMSNILNELKCKPDKVYIDAADVNEQRFGMHIASRLDFETSIISVHGADISITILKNINTCY